MVGTTAHTRTARPSWLALVLLLVVLLQIPRTAQAAQGNPLTLQVGQSVSTEAGMSPQSVSVGYKLTPQSRRAPMPEGSSNGAYRFAIVGNGAATITWSNLSTPGQYRYVIEPEGASAGTATSSPERIDLLLVVSDDAGATKVQAAAYYPDGKKGELGFTQAIEGGVAADGTQKGGITPRTGDPTSSAGFALVVLGLAAVSLACSHALSRESGRGSEENS